MEKNVPEAQRNGMCKSTVGGDVARGLGQLGAQSLVLKGTQALEGGHGGHGGHEGLKGLAGLACGGCTAAPWGGRRVSV